LLDRVVAAEEREEKYPFTFSDFDKEELKIARILASSNVLCLACTRKHLRRLVAPSLVQERGQGGGHLGPGFVAAFLFVIVHPPISR
jgi:hypothetical protein